MSYEVFQPVGLMDGISTNKLRSDINNVLADGVKTILIDLKDVIFINGSAIGALVATFKTVNREESTLSFCSLSDQVSLIFELTKMNNIFDIAVDRQDFMQKKGLAIS